jgi:hypothetical protein
MKGAAAQRRRQNRHDKEGSGGATMKGAVAPQGRQRLRDKEGSGGGAMMKTEPAGRQ